MAISFVIAAVVVFLFGFTEKELKELDEEDAAELI